MGETAAKTILKINSSGRVTGSHSRRLLDKLAAKLQSEAPGAQVIERDVSAGMEFLDEAWIGANFTPADTRSDAQAARLQGSDALVAEVQAADTLLIAVPIYNFGVPAALKAWVDQICRAGVTFRYGANGPEGMLEGKTAHLVVTSGGTRSGSEIDFATGYMRHVLGFVGITDVRVIAADRLMAGEAEKLAEVDALIAAA
ncbi:FMN-dependent NADH-azoreductase [Pseudaestuariivita sp.]|uniref:FMN-dependent NADH-azoreductase n=1 Tax=Pseudaestuariivita sp. TaxID=2211669 RepID=UPI004059F297